MDVTKQKSGEYRVAMGDVLLTVRRDFYMGGWKIWHSDVGLPWSDKTFLTKRDALDAIEAHYD